MRASGTVKPSERRATISSAMPMAQKTGELELATSHPRFAHRTHTARSARRAVSTSVGVR